MSSVVSRKRKRPAARAYRSPLRAILAEETRRRILDAAMEEMEQAGPEGFSVPGVAARSRIALRTIYRHFPTRDALVDATWQHSYERYDWIQDIAGADDLPAAVAAAGVRNGQTVRLLDAALRCPRQIALRDRTRPQRMDHVAKVLAPEIKGLSPAARRRVLGVLHALTTPSFWHVLHVSWCPDGAEAGQAAAWALRAVLAELRRNPKSAETTIPPAPAVGRS